MSLHYCNDNPVTCFAIIKHYNKILIYSILVIVEVKMPRHKWSLLCFRICHLCTHAFTKNRIHFKLSYEKNIEL